MQIDEVRFAEDMEPLGLNWVKLGLQDVLYDPRTQTVYTPNTNKASKMGEETLPDSTDGGTLQEEERAQPRDKDGRFASTGSSEGGAYKKPSGFSKNKNGEVDLRPQILKPIRCRCTGQLYDTGNAAAYQLQLFESLRLRVLEAATFVQDYKIKGPVLLVVVYKPWDTLPVDHPDIVVCPFRSNTA